MFRVSSAVATHTGMRRPGNEDAFCNQPDLGLYVVADGMGGHVAGEVASRTVVVAIEAFIAAALGPESSSPWPAHYDPAIPLNGNRLKTALHLANREIGSAIERDASLRGMATTAVAVLVTEDTPVVAHVGDSRAYLWRGGSLRALTQDHSWVVEQVRAGVLSQADAERHPWRNVVTRAIAGGPDPEVDVASLDLMSGDRLLLCSDGLSAVVPHHRLESVFAWNHSLQDTCDALVEAANDAGGPDNITALTLHIDVA